MGLRRILRRLAGGERMIVLGGGRGVSSAVDADGVTPVMPVIPPLRFTEDPPDGRPPRAPEVNTDRLIAVLRRRELGIGCTAVELAHVRRYLRSRDPNGLLALRLRNAFPAEGDGVEEHRG